MAAAALSASRTRAIHGSWSARGEPDQAVMPSRIAVRSPAGDAAVATCAARLSGASQMWMTGASPKRPKPSRKSSAVPITTTRSASVFSNARVRVNASSWSAGRHPRPRPLNQHGTRMVSTKRVSASHAPSQYTSLPTMIAGRSAAAINAAAASTSAGSGSMPFGTLPFAAGSDAGSKITSIGKSRNTGPRWGVIAVRTACWISFAVSFAAVTVRADLVIDETIGT